MKRNKIILLQLFIAFTLICTSVYAAVDATISVSTPSTTLHKGDEFTVTLALEKVDSSKKVESIEGYINYNKNILETVTVDSIEKTSDGTVKIGDEELPVEDLTNKSEVSSTDAYIAFNGSPSSGNDVKIVIDFKNGISSNTDLLKIKFKVKSDASLGTVTNAISYETFQITAGSETSADITKNINLTITESTEHTHNWKENTSKSKAATCTEDGYTYYECTEDGCTETKKETIKATGHKYGDWKVTKEATTTSEGEKQRECSVCKNVEKQTIAKLTSNTNTNKTNTNTNTNKTNTNTNKTNTTNTDNTVAGTTIPATGSKVIILPAILLIALAYISYNKYMKYKDI